MLIYYNCFWGGFTNDTDAIDTLFSDIFTTEIKSTRNINDADILCESVYICFEPSLIARKKWSYTFMLSFENHYGECEDSLDKYTCVIGGPSKSKNTVPFPYFLFRCLQCSDVTFTHDADAPINVPNKNVCAVITNAASVFRTNFLNYLDGVTKIDYGGTYKNNIGGIIGGHHGSLELVDFYKQYKFVITIENSAGDTYITEKIFNALRAGVIPIYWGSQNIGDLINTERIIQIHNDTPEEFARVGALINTMSDETYAAIIQKPVFVKPFQHIYKQTIQRIQKCIVGGQNI